MRAPRSLLLLLGGAALLAGAALAFSEYSVPFSSVFPYGAPQSVRTASILCMRPVRGAFASGKSAGWFAYAPSSGVLHNANVACAGQARWRVAVGAALIVIGVVSLVVWFRQSQLGRDADEGVEPRAGLSGASPPPPASGSGPNPGGPAPS